VTLVLEVKAGRLAGKKLSVSPGSQLTIGRAPGRANFAIPHDSFMSSLHFAVECGPEGSRVQDRKSSNGTFLNGERITEAALSDGDEIRSGRTVFLVRIVAEQPQPQPAAHRPPAPPPAQPLAQPSKPVPPAKPDMQPEPLVAPIAPKPVASTPAPLAPPPPEPPPAPRPAAAQPRRAAPAAPAKPPLIAVGSWNFAEVPEGWQPQGEFGLQRAENEAFPSSIVATEEMLGLAALQRYVEAQVAMLQQYLREPRIEASLPPAIAGAEETVALDIRYTTNDGQVIVMRRIFARRARHVGVLTLTTLEKDLDEIRPAIQTILAAASFQPPD
jgi:hypothetical protein